MQFWGYTSIVWFLFGFFGFFFFTFYYVMMIFPSSELGYYQKNDKGIVNNKHKGCNSLFLKLVGGSFHYRQRGTDDKLKS